MLRTGEERPLRNGLHTVANLEVPVQLRALSTKLKGQTNSVLELITNNNRARGSVHKDDAEQTVSYRNPALSTKTRDRNMMCWHRWKIVEKEILPSVFEQLSAANGTEISLTERHFDRPCIVTYQCEKCSTQKVERV